MPLCGPTAYGGAMKLSLLVAVLLAALPAAARAGAPPARCPGAPLSGTAITGEFSTALQGSYVLVPFRVPTGTTAVRVRYCYDQPESPTSAQLKHTLDLGLYQARDGPGDFYDGDEFRGWGGSSHPDVTVSAEGFSTEQQYLADPKAPVPGKTTRAFLPGPIPAGRWAVELGVAAVVGTDQGDSDGKVAWRVEIGLSDDPAYADEPYRPAAYDRTPARRTFGWYAGDVHVHGEQSALGDAPMSEVFDYAFRPAAQGGAGLDFLTLSDYVSGASWGEIGRYQSRYPGKLIARSAEVVTYRGHTNAQGVTRFSDYRMGPVLERLPDGSLVTRRPARAPRRLFAEVQARGGWTQVNHPTIFPSEVPGFASLCRGCPWDYSDAETNWSAVDAYEVHTGPAGSPGLAGEDIGPNPFTLSAIREYDRLRRAGFRLAAVASSDSHNAGRVKNAVTQSPIGIGTTVVGADELSEAGIRRAVKAGRTYVKLYGAASPDLRLDASAPDGETATIGGVLRARRARLVARVFGGRPTAQARTLVLMRDGSPVSSVPVTSADQTFTFAADGPGDYRLQLMRGSAIDGLTTPIRLGARAAARPRLRVVVSPRRARAGRRVRVVVRVRGRTDGALRPVRGAAVRLGRVRRTTSRAGRAVFVRRFARRGRVAVRATRRGYRRGRGSLRVVR